MAKAGFWLKGSRGKLGGSTLQKGSAGGTVIRANAESIKNPQTIAQAFQRMVFGTVASAKGALKTIVDHSFEGIDYGVDSLSYFQSINNNILRAAALRNDSRFKFDIKGAGVIVPNEYLISQGSLSMRPYVAGQWVRSSGRLGGVIVDAPGLTTTYPTRPGNAQGYIDLLKAIGVDPGDQLTLVVITEDIPHVVVAQYEDAKNVQSYVTIARIVFKTVDQISDFSQYLLSGNQPNPNYFERVEGNVYLEYDEDQFEFHVNTQGKTLVGAACIRSKKGKDGKWRRSTAKMLCEYGTSNQTLAIDTYPSYMSVASSSNFESDYYLNNGLNEGTSQSVEFPVNVRSLKIATTPVRSGLTSVISDAAPVIIGEIDNATGYYIGFFGPGGMVAKSSLPIDNDGEINCAIESGSVLDAATIYDIKVTDASGNAISDSIGRVAVRTPCLYEVTLYGPSETELIYGGKIAARGQLMIEGGGVIEDERDWQEYRLAITQRGQTALLHASGTFNGAGKVLGWQPQLSHGSYDIYLYNEPDGELIYKWGSFTYTD